MGAFFGGLLAIVIGVELGRRWWEKARLRRTARAFSAGRDAVFPGWVLGRRAYCRPSGGLLVVAPDAFYHVVDRGMPITRRDIPVERLAVVRRRRGKPEDHKHMPANWAVLECLDDGEAVVIACHEAEMRYVEEALRRG